MAARFYADLPAYADFNAIVDGSKYVPLPPDWIVIIADILDSSSAIAAGRYKEVNFIGAAAITALQNCAGELEVPFVFGGDGATAVIPPELATPVHSALQGVQQLAKTQYGLTLRVGSIAVAEINAVGWQIAVLKYALAAETAQAMFSGGGLAFAERLIKDSVYGRSYLLPANPAAQVDLSGLECRWQDIPSPHEETVSLLVAATTDPSEDAYAVYQAVLQLITAIYGQPADYHPVRQEHLHLSLSPRRLLIEARTNAAQRGQSLARALLAIWIMTLVGVVLLRRKSVTEATDWGRYPALVQATTDYQKYDDTLRMVIAGTAAQRARLIDALEGERAAGRLAYGYHVSDRAVMTCLVYERMGRQIHFIDGADGGYAEAARYLKERLRSYTPAPPHAQIALNAK